MSGSMARVAGVLLDLGGVVYTGSVPLPGALEAIARLHDAGLPVRFITNTTRRSRERILADLADMGLAVAPDELLTPSEIAVALLRRDHLKPHLLVHPGLEPDFAGDFPGDGEAVVIGDAGAHFAYATLNAAFRKLNAGAAFLALAKNRSFADDDGQLSLDAGPFVAALEYATGRAATVLGKPSPDFFALAVESLGVPPESVAMVGDDVEGDVLGALDAGLMGILVRTGKYRAGDEASIPSPPTLLADDLAAATDWLIAG
jgi:HAD superfamily hydrolase (TIGR01458 family)